MRKARKITISVVSGIFIMVLLIAAYINNYEQHTNKGHQMEEADNQKIDISQLNLTDGMINASYVDGSESLDEMLQNADVIVKCIVSDISEERQMGIFFTVDIEKVIKGDYVKNDKITVLTLKGEDELKVNETYVLVLSHDSYYDDDTFHIMSGNQGIFSLDGKNIKNKEPKFESDINKIMSDKGGDDLSPLDKLCNGFAKHIK